MHMTPPRDRGPLVEIVRSFAFKLNTGNYESRDFFCSRKAECYEDEADAVSAELHDWCRRQVQAAVKAYQSEPRGR